MSIEAMKQVIEKLRISMTDARQNESNFESWMILNEAICDSIDDLRKAIAESALDRMAENARELGLTYESKQEDHFRDVKKMVEQAQPVGEVLNERGDVDWISFVPTSGTSLYTTPPQRKPLTDEEIQQAAIKAIRENKLSWLGFCKDEEGSYTVPVLSPHHLQLARAIEAKLKENT